jgi:hypothetical protein
MVDDHDPLCPWSGARCCECCPARYPWRENGLIPTCCQAWRTWTRQEIFVELVKQPWYKRKFK